MGKKKEKSLGKEKLKSASEIPINNTEDVEAERPLKRVNPAYFIIAGVAILILLMVVL